MPETERRIRAPPFLRAGELWSGFVDHKPFKFRILDKLFKHSFPYSFVALSTKAPVSVPPVPVFERQLAPRCTGPKEPRNGFLKKVITRRVST